MALRMLTPACEALSDGSSVSVSSTADVKPVTPILPVVVRVEISPMLLDRLVSKAPPVEAVVKVVDTVDPLMPAGNVMEKSIFTEPALSVTVTMDATTPDPALAAMLLAQALLKSASTWVSEVTSS